MKTVSCKNTKCMDVSRSVTTGTLIHALKAVLVEDSMEAVGTKTRVNFRVSEEWSD